MIKEKYYEKKYKKLKNIIESEMIIYREIKTNSKDEYEKRWIAEGIERELQYIWENY